MENSSTFKIYLFLLFPGFFFFHILHSIGLTPYIGWFSIIIALGTFLLITESSLRTLANPRFVPQKFIVASICLGFFSYCLISITLRHQIFTEPYYTKDGLIWNATNILLLTGFFMIGIRLKPRLGKLGSLALFLSYIAFASCTWAFYSNINATIILPIPEDANPDSIASYQSMAMCVLYTFLTICVFCGKKAKTAYYIASLAILYFIGSRSEFFLLLLILPPFIYINYGPKRFFELTVISAVAAPAFLLSIGFNERFSSVISELSSDSARGKLLSIGLEGIASNPITGDYLGQVRDSGTPGAYIHNALSVYQQFGLAGFSLYCSLTALALLIGIALIKSAKTDSSVETLVYTALISIVGISISKSIGWPLPGLSWGLACMALGRYAPSPSGQNLNQYSQ